MKGAGALAAFRCATCPSPMNLGAKRIAGGSVCISKNTTFSNNFASITDPDIFGSYTVC